MKRTIMAFLLVAALCAGILATVSFADFGDFGGDYDFGDYGGYDNDWGNDYDYDDDYDSDFSFIPIILGSGGNSGGTLLFIIIVLVVIYLLKKRKSTGTQQHVQVNNAATGLSPMSDYAAIDESFSESELCEKLGNLYVRLQNCWTAGDIEELRPYFTDAQFNQYKAQLDRLKEQGLTNMVERISVMSVAARGFTQSGGEDRIVLRLQSRITDYTVDGEGKVVKGSKTAEKFMTYEFDMTRPTGTKTSESTGTTVHNCPNCGAPLDINSTAKCPYCDSIITVDKHDWVIAAIRGISQQTLGN